MVIQGSTGLGGMTTYHYPHDLCLGGSTTMQPPKPCPTCGKCPTCGHYKPDTYVLQGIGSPTTTTSNNQPTDATYVKGPFSYTNEPKAHQQDPSRTQ